MILCGGVFRPELSVSDDEKVAAEAAPTGLIFVQEGLSPRTSVFDDTKVAAKAAPPTRMPK
jgi:hypothetical protein